MSKFVTYPAVTVLDNDHSLLIDDPNAGTNSITAENAGNTLLSKWAGFETFDEAVQNTIEHNQEFIDRDTAIREETAELKKKIVTTFPSKDASGQIATFESEFEDAPLKSCIVRVEPVQDLHGYDSPWPAGGGKNKFPGASHIGGGKSYGLTWIPQEDGGMKISGTVTDATWLYRDRYIDLENFYGFSIGDTITVSGKDTAGNYMTALHFYNGSTLLATVVNGKSVVIPEGTTRVRLLVYAKGSAPGVVGETINNTVYMQIESGSTATAWTPYSNICPISGWTGCEVQRTGKNLLSNTVNSVSTNGITFTVNDDRSITANGTATARANLFYSGALYIPPGEYYLSTGKIFAVMQCYFEIVLYKAATGSNVYINTNGRSGNPFTVEKGDCIRQIYFSVFGGKTFNDTIYPQIEVGSTATPYEPYTGQTYPITFPTEAGTVYGGYIDPINGEMVVDRAMVDLGTCNIAEYVDTNITNHLYSARLPYRLPYYAKNVDSVHLKCSALKPIEVARPISYLKALEPNTVAIRQTYTDRIYIKSEIDTVEAMKQSLDGVQLVYPLANPIHYPITATEIKTLLGQNNLWADTGDVSVEYLMSDVSWYVEKKLRAFQSILAGVEDSSTASKNYSANTYLIFNDDIYKTTKAITAGETIEEGVNVTKTTVAEQLLALAQA